MKLMDLKKGNWNPLAPDTFDSDLLSKPKKVPPASKMPSSNPPGRKGVSSQSPAGRGSSQDHDLMASMMKRVTQLEQANAELRVQIKAKAVKIEMVEADNLVLSSGEAKPEIVSQIKQVRKEKEELASIVKEMTQFLADYGLTWVGEEPPEGAFNYN